MWRLLLLAALFYLIIRVGRGLLAPPGHRRPTGGERIFVRDALTGVYFPESEAVTVTTGGETYHFSSIGNRDAWLSGRGRQQ
jgi:hypothetical protein